MMARFNLFVGHIGGDDFFAAVPIEDASCEKLLELLRDIIRRFEEDVQSFYHMEDRLNGYIVARTREGRQKKYPLLTVSTGCVYLKGQNRLLTPDMLSQIFAQLKKKAKESGSKIALMCIDHNRQTEIRLEKGILSSLPSNIEPVKSLTEQTLQNSGAKMI